MSGLDHEQLSPDAGHGSEVERDDNEEVMGQDVPLKNQRGPQPPAGDGHSPPAAPPSPSGKSRAQQNALGINIPPPSLPSGPLTAPAAPFPPPALRRTSSSLSGGSAGGGSGTREKKRLRFTPLVGSSDRDSAGNSRGSPTSGSDDGWERESDYDPEHAGSDMEDLHREGKGKGKWRGSDHMKSDPGTPSLAETADQIRRTLSLASLDHLLALSANQGGERERLLAEVQKAGKDLVWRDAKEKRLYPKDAERTLVLATKRGLRSFLLSFSVRAGVNVLLTLFLTMRKRKLRLYMILHAIFGQEPFRFGAMIGTFTFLNTLTLHLLRLAPPLSYLRRRLKAGLFNKTSFGPPEREGAEGERRWQAAVAGAVGSLGLLWETRARRRGVAQQMFVRGLQGTYNHYTPRYGIHIPHGDVLLFGLCCGQIMFAFLMSPETMPKEYINWIQSASRVPEYAVTANRTAVRQGTIEPIHMQRALQHNLITPHNKTSLEKMLQAIKDGWQPPAAAPCEMVHPWLDSCKETSFRRFFAVMRFMLPVYSALHLIPALVLRRAHFQREPVKMLMRVLWGITRSCSFLGGFVVIYQALFCMRSQILFDRVKLGGLMQSVVKAIRGKQIFWAIGFMTSASLFLEEKKRRAELAMYVLPRALEAAWSSARRRAYVPIVPFGETILGGIAMAMVMDTYKHKPAALSGVVRRLMYQLVGPV